MCIRDRAIIDDCSIKFLKIKGLEQAFYDRDTEIAYENAIRKWKKIASEYSTKKIEETFYGIKALREAASLASFLRKHVDEASLLNEIITKYSNYEEVSADVAEARFRLMSLLSGSASHATLRGIYGFLDVTLLGIEVPAESYAQIMLERDGEFTTATYYEGCLLYTSPSPRD